MRTPMVDVRSRISLAMASASPGRQTQVSRYPGRPFFMITWAMYASLAPWAIRRSMTGPRSSGVMSSMLHSICITVGNAPPCSPMNALTMLVEPSRLPKPHPTPSETICGMPPNDSAKWRTMATPVGVAISPSWSPENAGTPSSRMAVAGAGTGIVPWAHSTVPNPVQIGDATMRSGASLSMSMQVPTTSAMASSIPTSWKWTSPTGLPWTRASAPAISA